MDLGSWGVWNGPGDEGSCDLAIWAEFFSGFRDLRCFRVWVFLGLMGFGLKGQDWESEQACRNSFKASCFGFGH